MSIIESLFKNQIETFEEKLKTAKNIAIIHHYNPDGDALGSSLGLYNTLIRFNTNVKVISPSVYANNLAWMPSAKDVRVLTKKENLDNIFDDVDFIFALDFNDLNRIANVSGQFDKSTAFKVLLDHHPGRGQFTDLVFSSCNYSSTAELVYEIIESSFLNQYFNKDAATCLYAGILTDTGSFQYSSSNPNLFRVVGKLLEQKIEKDKIYNNLFNASSVNRVRFMGYVMQKRMVVFPELKTAYIYITAKDRHDFCEQYGDTENFVNIPLQIKGIVFSAIFIEREGFIKASFRSKGTFDVNTFSQKYFNGGGHVNASGGESYDTLANTCKKFEDLLQNYAEELKNYVY